MANLAVVLGSVALLVAIIALALAAGVAVRVKTIEENLNPPRAGLASGAPAPREPLTTLLDGNAGWLDGAVVLFGSKSCEPCRHLTTGLNGALPSLQIPIVLVEQRDSDGSLAELAHFAVTRVLDVDGAVRAAFQAFATPHTFLVLDARIADQQLGADVDRVVAMCRTHAPRIAPATAS